jgi:CDP-glucose 4,6-dehydratase
MVTHTIRKLPAFNLCGLNVLVTGHTGFKGSWLCEWLLQEGASVSGISLPPETPESLFSILRLEERIKNHIICDIRDSENLANEIKRVNPDIIFHLAAQALVRRSYREPLETWQTNVAGTLNVLEGAKALNRPITMVAITTDKVYKNREWEYPYREEDELGGHDPYSASKAACEIAVASWRASFGSKDGVTVVTARAGNVIGGGDNSEDRIIPDCFRSWRQGKPVELRNPLSTRPWQHVLEPLSGYLALASHVSSTPENNIHTCNFGPEAEGHCTVEKLVKSLATLDPSRSWLVKRDNTMHEAKELSLSIDRARYKLGWKPILSFDETIQWTNEGYILEQDKLPQLIRLQIEKYRERR